MNSEVRAAVSRRRMEQDAMRLTREYAKADPFYGGEWTLRDEAVAMLALRSMTEPDLTAEAIRRLVES